VVPQGPISAACRRLIAQKFERAMADQRARNLYRQSGDRRQRSSSCVAEHADRWVTRAAVMLLALGLWSSVEGLTVVAHADLGTGIHYLAGSLHTRGWIAICVGIVAIFVGMRARRDDRRWRWAAVTTLVMSAIAQLVMICQLSRMGALHLYPELRRSVRADRLRGKLRRKRPPASLVRHRDAMRVAAFGEAAARAPARCLPGRRTPGRGHTWVPNT